MKRWTWFENWARTPRVALASFLICFLTILIAGPCWADDAATKAARELARKIAAQVDHKKTVSLELVDVTSEFRPADLIETRIVIASELKAHDVSVSDVATSEVRIRVTLSSNNLERLWIAEYDNDGAHVVVISPFEQSSLDLKPWLARAHLDRELVFSGNAPILDFVCTEVSVAKNCGPVMVLYSDAVVLMAADQNFPRVNIAHENPWPRDLRGRLKVSRSDFQARIEGVECTGNIGRIPSSKCAPVNGPWIFSGPEEVTFGSLAPSRNWFQGPAAVGSNGSRANRGPFFLLAGLELNGDAGWIVSGTNGETSLFAGKTGNVLATIPTWGSELATVKSDCSNGWQILATSKRDHTESDSITVYEWTGTEFRALSDPLDISGTVMAMWSAEDGAPARAVVRNLKTGNYEAYLLKVGCSQ